MSDRKLDSPSFHRNIEPILALLKTRWAGKGLQILEIGSGSGQHIERFGREFPEHFFQPSETQGEMLASINSWVEDSSLINVATALQLDVTTQPWFQDKPMKFDVFTAFNVIHISPWAVSEALFCGASNNSNKDARVFLYGPFKINGLHTSDSNADFEQWLQAKSPEFGVRDIADVNSLAENSGFKLQAKHDMPANNFMLEFLRS